MAKMTEEFLGFRQWLLDYYADPNNWHTSIPEARKSMMEELEVSADRLPTIRTMNRWRISEEFQDKLYEQHFAHKRGELKELLESAFREAKDGNYKFFEFLMEYYGKFKSKSEVDLNVRKWEEIMEACATTDKTNESN